MMTFFHIQEVEAENRELRRALEKIWVRSHHSKNSTREDLLRALRHIDADARHALRSTEGNVS